MILPELLLPAGDLDKLQIAFQYGADAVYAGVPAFSLRTKENEFDLEKVREAITMTRKLKKTIYLTLNIYPRNRKLPLLSRAIQKLAELSPDAFIVADPGVIMICKELAPAIPLHLSVQANNVNWASAQFWHRQGVSRIILSREISLPEIREIHEKNPTLELEFFVHGSICMAYSGRCLLSSYFLNRDANQGICAQSCRWKYKMYLEEEKRPGEFIPVEEDDEGTYIMNSKDLCLIKYLHELRDAGIESFKVEGRNKTIHYVATVAKAYRRALDDMNQGKPFDEDLLVELRKASNRGFIPGFLTKENEIFSQDYERNATHQTHEFVGVVREIVHDHQKAFARIEVKGRMDSPVEVEVMTPQDEFLFTIPYFITSEGERITTVHPGQKDFVLIECDERFCVGAMMRKARI